MTYLAIARRWRPSRFEDLVGQIHVVQTLKNAIRLKRIAHAYLFSGARGVGKTSVARIFAKALRCPNAVDGSPCNECVECIAISESRSVDVAEIDGASNNGVEAVRGIRENVAYGAATGHYKIYIIDEVHMLSLSAFNALLKTLEEPPPHVVFIFATTEMQKIPLTILSRCQRFEFRRFTPQQMVERLQQILIEEKVTITEEGLRTIASYADGSLRDALSLLYQVLSFYGNDENQFDNSKIIAALGVSEGTSVTQLVENILRQNTVGILSIIERNYLAGVDLKHFSERCLEEIRALYLLVLAKEAKDSTLAGDLDLTAGHLSTLQSLAQEASLIQVERMAQIFGKTIHQLGWSSLPRFVLEMNAIRMSKLGALEQIEAAALNRQPETPTEEESPVPQVPVTPRSPVPMPSALPREHTLTGDNWKGFVDAVLKKRPLLGALLSHAGFKFEATQTGRTIFLSFPEGSFYERQALETRNSKEISQQVTQFFGPSTSVSLTAKINSPHQSLEKTRQTEESALKKKALEQPAVAQIQQALGAEVVDINVRT